MLSRVLSLKEKELWSDYIKRLPIHQQDVYYTPEYYSLYENYGDGEALCFVYVEDNRIVLYPFLKNSINALGYNLEKEYFDIQGAYGYNGIVTSCNDEQFISRFHAEFNRFCVENSIVAEFTRFHPLLKNELLVDSRTSIILDRKTVNLNLFDNNADFENGFSKEAKKHIRRAIKQNIEIREESCNPTSIGIFKHIYKQNMDNVNAVDYLYFNEVFFNELFTLPNIDLFIAYLNEQPIACYSCLFSNNYYHTFLSASIAEYNKTGVNPLLYSWLIGKAVDRNCKFVHLGGGTNGDINNSLFKFKSNFSRSLSDFYIGKRVYNEQVYTEVVNQWKDRYPDLYEKNRVKLLGYREI